MVLVDVGMYGEGDLLCGTRILFGHVSGQRAVQNRTCLRLKKNTSFDEGLHSSEELEEPAGCFLWLDMTVIGVPDGC